eukprot:4699605-Ditylum_brightwellii.AAC.1
MKYVDGPMASTPEETDDAREKQLLLKPLYGVFFKDQKEIPQVDMEHSWHWLCKSGICYETEASICAAQEQALAINNIQKRYGNKMSHLCANSA